MRENEGAVRGEKRGSRREAGLSWSVRGPAVPLSFTGEWAPTPQQPACRPQPGTLPEPSLSPQRAPSLQEPPLPHASPGKHHSWLALWPGRKRNRCPRSQLFSDTWACTLTEHAHIHTTHTPPMCRLTRAHVCSHPVRTQTSHSGTHSSTGHSHVHKRTRTHITHQHMYSMPVRQHSGSLPSSTQSRGPCHPRACPQPWSPICSAPREWQLI